MCFELSVIVVEEVFRCFIFARILKQQHKNDLLQVTYLLLNQYLQVRRRCTVSEEKAPGYTSEVKYK